ncbi:MAG: hypothetical protein JNJ55_07400 [Betaproteobacteria bacterium]|nr:hypothetical protein [Betaproteobacteria bacterium]
MSGNASSSKRGHWPALHQNPTLLFKPLAGLVAIPALSIALDFGWNLGFVRTHGSVDSALTSFGGRRDGQCWRFAYRYTDLAGAERFSDSTTSTVLESWHCGDEANALAQRFHESRRTPKESVPVTVWVHRWFPSRTALVRNGLVPVWLTGALMLAWVLWVHVRFGAIPPMMNVARGSRTGH